MYYVIGVTYGRRGSYKENEITKYTLYDTITEYINYFGTGLLGRLMHENSIEVKNATLVPEEYTFREGIRTRYNIQLNDWPHEIATTLGAQLIKGTRNIVISKTGNKYKLVSCFGQTLETAEEVFKSIVSAGTIANCRFTTDNQLLIYDEYIENDRNTELEADIEEKYKLFILKTRAMGIDNSFEYKVDGDRVKIVKYTGISKKVVLPNFITDITGFAFSNCEIEKIALNPGLKTIGCCAFESNNLQKLDIPDSVEFIGTAAFGKNAKLLRPDKTGMVHFKDEAVTYNKKNTLVLGHVKTPGLYNNKTHKEG